MVFDSNSRHDDTSPQMVLYEERWSWRLRSWENAPGPGGRLLALRPLGCHSVLGVDDRRLLPGRRSVPAMQTQKTLPAKHRFLPLPAGCRLGPTRRLVRSWRFMGWL